MENLTIVVLRENEFVAHLFKTRGHCELKSGGMGLILRLESGRRTGHHSCSVLASSAYASGRRAFITAARTTPATAAARMSPIRVKLTGP